MQSKLLFEMTVDIQLKLLLNTEISAQLAFGCAHEVNTVVQSTGEEGWLPGQWDINILDT